MPPENLFQFLERIMERPAPQKDLYLDMYGKYSMNGRGDTMEPAKAVSTGVAHDEMDTLLVKDELRTQSLLDFIGNAISTVPGINAEETSYGKAIAQLVKEHGSPVIRQKEWSGIVNGKLIDDHDPPAYFSQDARDPSLASWPVDTLTTTPGNVEELMAELAHQRQFNVSPEERNLLNTRFISERELYPSPHNVPGTVEWEAHTGRYEPEVKERFATLLDSLQSIYGETLRPEPKPPPHFDPLRNMRLPQIPQIRK